MISETYTKRKIKIAFFKKYLIFAPMLLQVMS
jgi:hypothetical protein